MDKKIFDGILICSDIDGTIFYQFPGTERGLVPENACRAIRYFQENGGRFTLATGRLPQYSSTALPQYLIPNAPTVTLNGAVIYDAKNDIELFKSPIKDEIARITYDVIERYPNMIRLDLQCSDNHSYSIKRAEDGNGYVYRDTLNRDNPFLPIRNRQEFSAIFGDITCYKTLYVFPAEDSESAREEISAAFPEYAISRSWKNGVELQNADADKGHSTRRLADILGDVRLLVCVGDYENDISMLRSADIGYAVADALESVRCAADRVTERTCKEGALEEIIYQLEAEFGCK